MDKRTIGIAVIVVALVAAMVPTVSAVPVGDSQYTENFATPTTNDTTGASNAARGGNITQANFIDVWSQTSKWQGYYGNLTGAVVLGDSTGTMKTWTWANSSNSATVLATTNSSTLDWWNYTEATGANIDTVWAFDTDDVDDGGATFDGTADYGDPLVLAGKEISLTDGRQALTWNANITANDWATVALEYGSPAAAEYDLMIFAGLANTTAYSTAYDNADVDYQMLVPVHCGSGSTQTFYFYVELR